MLINAINYFIKANKNNFRKKNTEMKNFLFTNLRCQRPTITNNMSSGEITRKESAYATSFLRMAIRPKSGE